MKPERNLGGVPEIVRCFGHVSHGGQRPAKYGLDLGIGINDLSNIRVAHAQMVEYITLDYHAGFPFHALQFPLSSCGETNIYHIVDGCTIGRSVPLTKSTALWLRGKIDGPYSQIALREVTSHHYVLRLHYPFSAILSPREAEED